MRSYPPRALLAEVRILERFNSLSVFVEDATKHNYYKELITRLMDHQVTIRKVFPCNGRLGVIRAAGDQRFNRFKHKIFIVDGDLYLLCGERQAPPSNVLVLDKYCVENYFICLDAAYELAVECECTLSQGQVARRLALRTWLRDTTRVLAPLFIWYAVAHDLNASIKTVSISGLRFLENGKDVVSMELVKKRIDEIKNSLERVYGSREVKKRLNRILRMSKKHSDKTNSISGKSYLMPLLWKRLASRSSFKDEHGMTMRLVRRCNLSGAQHIKEAIDACLVGSSSLSPVT